MIEERPRLGPVLELLRLVAEQHDVAETGNFNVVPVLMTAASPSLSLFKALAKSVNGWFDDSEADDLSGPIVNGSLPEDVRIAVETALSVRTGVVRRTVKVRRVKADTWDVSFEELLRADTASEGEQRLLRLARSFLRPGLHAAEFAVVAYSDAGMDVNLKRATWGLLDQLRELKPATLKTLVLLTEATELLVPIHCQHGRGFTYAHWDNELLVRNPPQQLMSRTAALASTTKPLVLFLGAGFSHSSRLPMGDSLRNTSIRRILGSEIDLAESSRLEHEFYEYERPNFTPFEQRLTETGFIKGLTFERVLSVEKKLYPGLPTLVELLAAEVATLPTPGPSVRHLHDMLGQDHRLVIVTVNLDRLIEHAVPDAVRVFATETEFEDAPTYIEAYLSGDEEAVPVLKVHGTIQDFDSCVVTDEVTRIGLSQGKTQALKTLLGVATASARVPWVYVGASMRDLDLQAFLQSPEFKSAVDEYWVAPYLVGTVREFGQARMYDWSTQGNSRLMTIQSRLVSETSDVFMAELAKQWARSTGRP